MKSFFSTVRVRLMSLLAAAAIPLVAMAAVLALHAYAVSGEQARARVVVVRETAAARHDAALEGAAQTVAALSHSALVWSGDIARCSELLKQLVALRPDRYADLLAVGPDGRFLCGARADDQARSFEADPWFRQTRDLRAPIQGRLIPLGTPDGTLRSGLVVSYPVVEQGRFAGAVVAILRLGTFTRGAPLRTPAKNGRTESWLVEPAGAVLPIEMAQAADLPSAGASQALAVAGDQPLIGRSAAGDLFAYAQLRLPDDLRLLSGLRVQDVVGKARATLIGQLFVLGMLLLLGLIAVALGADRAVVRPVKSLSHAVRRWRAGQVLDVGNLQWAPVEIMELGQAFARTTAALAEREAELRAAAAHQELLMQEIHHRVKNNLQIVASLLNLQAKRIRQPEARAEFQSARDRVRALATLHRHLYAEGELHAIHMRPFLMELCGQLFQAMGETEGDRITLDIDAPELEMSSDQAVPLSLLVTEAVSNAIKYAFPDGRRGQVSIRIVAHAGVADLVIADDGVGIDASRGHDGHDPREGLGLALMRGFARQLGSELRVEQDGGTRYSVAITLQRERAERMFSTGDGV